MAHRGTSLIGLLPALAQGLPDMLRSVSAALRTVDARYADFLDGGHAAALAPAEVALRRLVWGAQLSLRATGADGRRAPVSSAEGPCRDGGPGDALIGEMFGGLGREQCRAGLPVGSLLAAYQVGGRAAWRHIAATAVDHGLPADCLAALAEELFSLVDQLGSVTIEAFVAEQACTRQLHEELRDALVDRLLSDRAERSSVEAAAQRAGWRLPGTAAVVFLRAAEDPDAAIGRLGRDCLRVRHSALPGAVVPDPLGPGRRDWMAAGLRGAGAVVGPAVPVDRLPDSARLAVMAARILPREAGDDAVFVEDRLDALVVGQDPELLDALRGRVLRPLLDAPPGSREALRDTLRSWLVHMGNRQVMARELGVHPQTVRYRLARLRDLFGPALDDPATRPSLMLAVAWDAPPVRSSDRGTDGPRPAPAPARQRAAGAGDARRRLAGEQDLAAWPRCDEG